MGGNCTRKLCDIAPGASLAAHAAVAVQPWPPRIGKDWSGRCVPGCDIPRRHAGPGWPTVFVRSAGEPTAMPKSLSCSPALLNPPPPPRGSKTSHHLATERKEQVCRQGMLQPGPQRHSLQDPHSSRTAACPLLSVGLTPAPAARTPCAGPSSQPTRTSRLATPSAIAAVANRRAPDPGPARPPPGGPAAAAAAARCPAAPSEQTCPGVSP